jgi:hypothetical protein
MDSLVAAPSDPPPPPDGHLTHRRQVRLCGRDTLRRRQPSPSPSTGRPVNRSRDRDAVLARSLPLPSSPSSLPSSPSRRLPRLTGLRSPRPRNRLSLPPPGSRSGWNFPTRLKTTASARPTDPPGGDSSLHREMGNSLYFYNVINL